MPDVFSDIKNASKSAEPGLTAADNSLSRALFCLQTTLTTAWATGGYAAAATYPVVVVAENMNWVPRYRGMRWMAPLGAFLTLQFVGARLGMIRSIDILSSNAAAQRRVDKAGEGEQIPLAPWAANPSPASAASGTDGVSSASHRDSMPSPAQEAWRAAERERAR